MLNYLKYLVVASLSFVVAMELFSILSFSNNLLENDSQAISFEPDPVAESVVFVGDSYAATVYVEDSYVAKYEAFFKDKGYNFIDLSRLGSSLDTSADLLDSVYTTHTPRIPKLVIYYYNMINVVGFENGAMADRMINSNTEARPKRKKGAKKKEKKGSWKDKSATILIIKDILHRVSLFFTNKPFPGTVAANHSKFNLKHKEDIRHLFNSIQAEHVIVLVNAPFNYGPRMRKWEHYDVFKSMELNDNVTLLQTIDIVDDGDHALSWRNGHPNQEAIDIIAERIMALANNILAEN